MSWLRSSLFAFACFCKICRCSTNGLVIVWVRPYEWFTEDTTKVGWRYYWLVETQTHTISHESYKFGYSVFFEFWHILTCFNFGQTGCFAVGCYVLTGSTLPLARPQRMPGRNGIPGRSWTRPSREAQRWSIPWEGHHFLWFLWVNIWEDKVSRFNSFDMLVM